MNIKVLSQGALLSLINTYDPFQRKETREFIHSRLQDVEVHIPDDYNYCEPSWGFFGEYDEYHGDITVVMEETFSL